MDYTTFYAKLRLDGDREKQGYHDECMLHMILAILTSSNSITQNPLNASPLFTLPVD